MLIIEAWWRISPEATVKGVSNAVDETDDDMLWNYSEENGDVRNEYEEDEDIVYEDGDSNTAW